MRTIRFRSVREEWEILGERRRFNGDGSITLSADELPELKAVDLTRALMEVARYYDADEADAQVTSVPREYADRDSPWSESSFEVRTDGQSSLILEEWGESVHPEESEDHYVKRAHSLLEPLLARNRAWIGSIEVNEASAYPLIGYRLRIGYNPRGRTLADMHEIGQSVLELLQAAATRSLTRESVGHLIRGGHADLLVGQEENDWFDAKVDHYEMSQLRGKIALARAVGRFANAERGGLVVVGVRTKKSSAGESVSAIVGVPVDGSAERRYRQALNQCLYPPVEFLTIESVLITESNRMLMLIDIPPQPEELKPFLVHGAIVDGNVEGAFISIVRRRGEESIPVTAPMIHSTLAAGRALLRGSPQSER